MRKKFSLAVIFLIICHLLSAQLNTDRYYNVGRSRIYFGNYTGAVENFNIVIKLKPYKPEPYFLRGVSKQFLEDFRGAISDYNKALEIKPYYPESYMYRAMANYELKNFENAINDYSKALEMNPDDPNIFNNRGIAWAAMDSLELAINDYNKAIEFNPKNTSAYLNRSAAYQRMGDMERGIADCDSAIAIRPHFAGAYLNRGLAKFSIDDYAGALTDYDESIRLDPENAIAFNNRGILKHKMGDFSGAIMDYDLALQLDAGFASAYMNRGLAKEVLKHTDFMSDYKMAAMLDPRFENNPYLTQVDPRAYTQSQHQHQRQQTKTSRKQGGTKSISAQTNKDDNQTAQQDSVQQASKKAQRQRVRRLAVNTQRSNQTQEEIDDGKVQNRIFDVTLQPLFVVSSFYSGENEIPQQQYYSELVDRLNQENSYNPYLFLSNNMENDPKTIELFKNYIRFFDAKISINSKIPSNYMNRGIFSALTQDYNNAITDFNKTIKLDQHYLLAYFERGNTKTQLADLVLSLPDFRTRQTVSLSGTIERQEKNDVIIHDYDQALNDYATVLKMNPNFFFAWYNRGNIFCKLGKYPEALDDYSKAIELEPDFAEAYYNRGLVYIYLNDVEKGSLDLSRAGELGLEDAYSVIKRFCN